MFSENKNFYPTPKNLIEKMLKDVDFTCIKTILEPSAGKGNIIEWLGQKKASGSWKYNNYSIDCIEVDKNLQTILRNTDFGVHCQLVHNDFLTYQTYKRYDLIIMNPPYDNGDKHLMKAIEMQEKTGGAIICLLNAETLKNPYSKIRQALVEKLEEYNAEIEYIENSFLDAERKTSVEIALIKCQLPKVKHRSFILEELRKAEEYKNETEKKETFDGQIVENDFIKAIVNQYQLELQAGIKLITEYNAMKDVILSSFGKDEKTGNTIQKGGCIINMSIYNDNYNNKNETDMINNFIQSVRRKYWSALFSNDKFTGQLTNNLKMDYQNSVDKLKDYDFTIWNIREIQLQMKREITKGIEDTIIDLFEELSNKYHWYDETSRNRHYFDGWKTNKSYRISQKAIIPLNGFRHSYYDGTKTLDLGYDVYRKLSDIEKCLNYLDGGLTEAIDLRKTLDKAQEEGQTKKIQLKYYNVTFFKKGTCHIQFTNEELLKKFNIYGAQNKRWLPPTYGKKTYEEMDAEEKSVIDSFEGEKSYKDTLNHTDYYLENTTTLNLLEMAS